MLTKAAAVILVLVISCTVPVVETPTPRPTYTPYPTLTPEPKPASPRAMKPTPTFAPELEGSRCSGQGAQRRQSHHQLAVQHPGRTNQTSPPLPFRFYG